MPDKLQITIVGLGLVGTSAGLALRRYADKVTVVGHDRDMGLAARAKSAAAVDRTEWNLINAVSKADRILLALPLSEIRDTLAAIAQDLKPGCVLLDTADVKAPVLRWAAELLPDSVHLVGGHPIVIAQDLDASSARADLFQDKLFCLVAGQGADDQALRLAADLIEALGAKPFFMDAVEHDGLAAAVEQLPMIVAGALLDMTRTSPAWADMRKLAGSQFYTSTLLVAEDGKVVAATCAANRDLLVQRLDAFIAELGEWRQRLAAGEDEALAKPFENGLAARHKWLNTQASGNWDEQPAAGEMPTSGGYFRQLIGLGRLGKQPAKPKK
ncbi:MAG: prephenate dehydrogenase/arogenate dehydrogenase family protein [Chloroflexi bacterium]|nr:prephenate dehydrogenase/arogenate dehydrogenase family protein [Chloroflexota bacterium]